jgi:hypothetical protein
MDVVINGFVPNQKRSEVMTDSTSSQLSDSTCEKWQHKNISQVYTRKKKKVGSQTQATKVVPVPIAEQCSSSLVPHDEPKIVDVSSTSEAEIDVSSPVDLPIALRKDAQAKAGIPPPRYGFEHDISNYVTYASLSLAYRAFVASLQSVVIPKNWREANHDPKW